ncbi:hypothetical protein A2U01_0114169, partial [Trifolium medium]|nr:hypothetical protein [Trifolium medium]
SAQLFDPPIRLCYCHSSTLLHFPEVPSPYAPHSFVHS